MSTSSAKTPRRPRRYDPGRRDRLIDVAMVVIAERGTAGASHRVVADAAEVPLGATTYYFESLEDLHAEALGRHAEAVLSEMRDALQGVPAGDALLECLVTSVMNQLAKPHELVLTVELYGLAVRKPRFYDIADRWIRETTDLLAEHMSDDAARAVNALMEGLVIHGSLSRTSFDRAHLERQLAQVISSGR